LISIYGTVYNNFDTVDKTIFSLYSVLPDFENRYELVIVDNFSIDGTWEKLLKIKTQLKNLKLIRYRSTRGEGRLIALQHTSGDQVMYVDFDCVFDPIFGVIVNKLSRIIIKDEIWDFGPPLRVGFALRETALKVGWRNLNYGEDWDFLYRAINMGVKVKYVSVGDQIKNLRDSTLKHGEYRYVTGNINYYLRWLHNKYDMVRSFKMTPAHALNISRNSNLDFISTLILSSIGSFGRRYLHPVKYSVYANTLYYLPQDLGLSRDRLFIVWEDINFTWNAIKNTFYEILKREQKIKLLIEGYNLVVSYSYKRDLTPKHKIDTNTK